MGWGKTVYTTSPSGLRMVNGMYSMNTRQGISMRMIGLKEVQQELNKRIKGIQMRSSSALLQIAMNIKEDMDSKPPLIPVDTGIMRSRFQILPIPNANPDKMAILLGWPNTGKEEYAPYVHEMTQPPYEHPINWSRPGSGPKFFEAAVKRNTEMIVQVIAMRTKKGL